MRLASLVCCALILGGCSVILDDIETPMCTSDDECLAASMYAGFPSTCNKYFCNEGRCVEYGAGAESCDGWDNDCDGLIDEPSASGDEVWREGRVLVEGASAAADVAYGALDERAVAIWSAGGNMGSHAPLISDTTSVPDPVQYLTSTGPSTSVETGCFSTSGGVAGCNFGAVATAPTSEHEILAAVTTSGCSLGRLLIGHTPPNASSEGVPMVIRGPDSLANSAYGVDVIPGGPCSGASRAACTDGSGDGCGAARPALSTAIDYGVGTEATQSRAAESVLAWLGDDVARPHCGGTAVPVEAVVVQLLRKQAGTPYFWVAASNDGIPDTLGTTTGGGAPALARFEGRGWVLGFGAEGGGVDLHWVDSQPAPPDTESTPMPPIQGLVSLGTVGTSAADHVALSVGATRAGGVEVGAAWIEGCGQGTQRLVFQRLLLSLEGARPSSASAMGPAVTLANTSGERALGTPAIRYTRDGFLVPGFARGGATADAGTDGGWTIAWVEGEDGDGDDVVDTNANVMAARVAELDGALVGDAAALSDAGVNADAPGLYGSGRFVYRNRDSGALIGGSATCSP